MMQRSKSAALRALGLCACVAASLAWAGPARAEESLTYLETAGRFADLKSEAEAKLARGAKAEASVLGYLCIAYGKLKQYEKLFACADRLEAIAQAGDVDIALDQYVMFISSSDARPLPQVLRARAWFELGDYAKASAAAAQALVILAKIPERGGTSLYPTARYRMAALEVQTLAASRAGHPAEAAALALQLEDVSRPIIGLRMWTWIKDNALAQVYMAMGRYQDALKYIPASPASMKVMVSFVNSLGPYAYRGDSTTSILEIPRLVMRGKALAETGKTAEAKSTFDEALASPRIRDMGDLYWVALYERGRLAQAEQQLDAAADYYAKAVEMVELQRSSINTEGSKIGFVGDKQGLYARLVALLLAQGKSAEAFDYVERSKSRALVDMLSGKNNFAVQGLAPERMNQLLQRLDAPDLPVPPPEGGKSTQPTDAPGAPLADRADRSEVRGLIAARQEVRAAAPEFSSLVTVGAVPTPEIQALLAADETLVEYYYQGDELVAFVVSRDKLQGVKLEGAGLADKIAGLRKALEDVNSAAWQAPARALHEQLWAPLAPLISSKNVVVVGHGALHYLPFAVLQQPDGGLLIDAYRMHYLPSASVLKYLRAAQGGGQAQLLVFGNPDLGSADYDLKFAEGEARTLAAMVPASRLLVRKEASKANFLSAAGGFSRLHFATHGKFESANPLHSGLFLAGDTPDAGLLTAGELYSTRLDTDLVTLSACETGLGAINSGDDVVGLTRGFLYAGSRSIVASLWSVDDRATGELMTAFYRNLPTMNKDEALRQAQLSTRANFPHPFFWAAFQLTGRVN
ncbi:MAG TPA: CHAT domain-containing protein [Burkholderiales bacterium]|jgi:CHAT domain-containing protein|nr:CHAT domain-containing protein [Burkholderiales bacterium]